MDFFGDDNAASGASSGNSPNTSVPPAADHADPHALPSRADVKTQEQLMADSIAVIEERGKAKFDELQAGIQKRTADADATSHDALIKMHAAADKELKDHVAARDGAVAAAKKTHQDEQKQLLSQQAKLQEKGSTWELAATHCDFTKPNSRATKSTDRMRKIVHSLTTEPNVPIGEGSQ